MVYVIRKCDSVVRVFSLSSGASCSEKAQKKARKLDSVLADLVSSLSDPGQVHHSPCFTGTESKGIKSKDALKPEKMIEGTPEVLMSHRRQRRLKGEGLVRRGSSVTEVLFQRFSSLEMLKDK